MRQIAIGLFAAFLSLMNVYSQSAEKLAEAWDKDHITTTFPSDVRYADLTKYLDRLRSAGISVEKAGLSVAQREIYQVEWGHGPLKVFMWSQMHGDEPTATSALVDMFWYLQKEKDRKWVKELAEKVTIRAVPMLNPDGAEAYKRRNTQGIDINRDALDQKTPEARLLKQLRASWSPDIGFNLHNQGALTEVGQTGKQAAISLLVVFGDEIKTVTAGHERNRRIASGIVAALNKFIPGHIARYSDEWTPTAFGDNFSAWGTPTILIETGALADRDEMFLVKINFIAFLTALNLVATGGEKAQDPSLFLKLPDNTSGGLVNFLFRHAGLPGAKGGATSDISAVIERRRASYPVLVKIQSIGNLSALRAIEEYDASGFIVVQRFGKLKAGEVGELFFYKRGRTVDFDAPDIETRFPPDAVFSMGKWTKGEKVLPKRP